MPPEEDETLGIPGRRWPYGPPEFHEPICRLHETHGLGYCDCKASDASDTEWGDGGCVPSTRREREDLENSK